MQFEDYPRPSLAVDPAVMSVSAGRLMTRLWQRTWEPDAGAWALPGVFVLPDESLEEAARRGIASKVGLLVEHPKQLFTWNRPGRDVRGWVVTVSYFAIATAITPRVTSSSRSIYDDFLLDASADPDRPVEVHVKSSASEEVALAFDHGAILGAVVARLRDDVWTSDVALRFLGTEFTLRALQAVFEAILGRTLNKDSFRRRVVQTQELVAPTGRMEVNVSHRPAELYRAAR